MKKVALTSIPLTLLACFHFSCNQADRKETSVPSGRMVTKELIPGMVLTRERQEKLTPDSVLWALRQRNTEYSEDNFTVRNTSERTRHAAEAQYPAAVVLSCLDSRVLVEDVFHSGIGDLFVARVAGNVADEYILASLEYACKESGAKLIVVLGHERCGAVKAAIDNVQLGHITKLLGKIRESMQNLPNFQGEKTSSNKAYYEAVTKQNVLSTIEYIRKESPILKEMEQKGEIKIVGGEYHMETGHVEFF